MVNIIGDNKKIAPGLIGKTEKYTFIYPILFNR
jgi:hypothetical protein